MTLALVYDGGCPFCRQFALATELTDINGQTAVFFVLVVAAAEVVVGLGIIVSIMRRRQQATADDLAALKG